MYISNDTTIKWRHERNLYCLHIQQDDFADSPRDWDEMTTMACWHRNYRLGDPIKDDSPEEFWRRLVDEHIPQEELVKLALEGQIQDIRIAANEEDTSRYDIFETCSILNRPAEEYLEHEYVSEDMIAEYLIEMLDIGQCMQLMKPYAEWMPLWLYDHSGISISCGERTYPYNDRWDSGQVGLIIAFKKTIMCEFSVDEASWRQKAIEVMKYDVKIYDYYLCNQVYFYTLYEALNPDADIDADWEEIDSCSGFYGYDIRENGIMESFDYGFTEAIESGNYEEGVAKRHVSYYYSF